MGGHAFPGTSPLSRAAAEEVIAELRAYTGWDLVPVGSFAFKDALPDLDLVVPIVQFDPSRLAAIGEVRRYNAGVTCLRVLRGGAAHQVDFFPTIDTRWGSWRRAGAPDSGADRAFLLRAAAATFADPELDWHLWDGDVELVRAGRTLDSRLGLRRIFKHRIGKRGGLLKSPSTVDASEFARMFGVHLPPVPTYTDPAQVREMILGDADVDDSTAFGLARYMAASFEPLRLRRVAVKLRECRASSASERLSGVPERAGGAA